MCPYYDEKYYKCNLSGATYYDEGDCKGRSGYDWSRCPNYTKSDDSEKVSKRLR